MNITQESTGDLTAVIKIELVKEDYENLRALNIDCKYKYLIIKM